MPAGELSRRTFGALSFGWAVLVLSGCQTLGPMQDGFEASRTRLDRAIDLVATSEDERREFHALARPVHVTARRLLSDHRAFRLRFGATMRDPTAVTADVRAIAMAYHAGRLETRDEMLRAVNALRRAMTAEQWPAVADAMSWMPRGTSDPRDMEAMT